MNIKRFGAVVSAVALPLALVSCGDDDDGFGSFDSGSDDAAELQEFADAMNEATGAAGAGGALLFDGQEYPVESAICQLDGDNIDVGTLGANYRIFVSGDPASPSLQILDPDGIQWFDEQTAGSGGKVSIDGSTVVAEEHTWWNNQNDDEITASFVVECP